MRPATIDFYIHCVDMLKSSHPRLLHNIYADKNELSAAMENKQCVIHSTPKTLFLLIPMHGLYHDLLYMASDLEALHYSMNLFLQENKKNLSLLRASIIGKEPDAEKNAAVFEQLGFTLGKKIARMRNLVENPSLRERLLQMQNYNDFMLDEIKVEFAVPGDEQEILDLLLTEFDICADNLPELPAIAANIKKEQVLVIRKNNRIAAMHYFTKKNANAYGWYDVTRKEHRKEYLYFAITLFLYDYWANRDAPTRSYSWRAVNNKRLMALAKQCNQIPDGVYIYNMLLPSTAIPEKTPPCKA